jgi:CBS domain-containing protein
VEFAVVSRLGKRERFVPMELAREFGAVVVTLGFATEQDVQEACREQRRRIRRARSRVYLVEILIERELLDGAKLARALAVAKGYREAGDDPSPRLGEIAIAKGYASPLQVWESLLDQKDELRAGAQRRLLGDIMVETCRLTPWELEDVLITAAELAAGSLRSGATPAEGFPVGENLFQGAGTDYARTYWREPVLRERTAKAPARTRTLLARDALGRHVRTTPDALLGEALEEAIDADADAILVFREDELVGVLSTCDARWGDRCSIVQSSMSRVEAVVDARAPLEDVAALIRERCLELVPVASGGIVQGVVGAAQLRLLGFPVAAPEVDLGGAG